MGYVLELRAARINEVAAELAEPSLTAAQVDAADLGLPDPDLDWARLQRLVAEAVVAGRPTTADRDVAIYLAAVVRHHSTWWGSIQHSSGGGVAFRTNLTTEVAPLLGTDFTLHLVARAMYGITTDDHPLVGWVGAAEIGQALSQAQERGIPPPEGRSSDLQTILRVVTGAAERGVDLVTVYD